ncbi:MAG: hypothetical protein K2Q01_09680 [Rickettsiales bacterium]|nr:hypothetical protein [Rickettsiales bacterium]
MVWGVAGWWALAGAEGLPGWLFWLSGVNLGLNFLSNWVFTLSVAAREPGLRRAALLFPLYLLLHSVASYKALWQLMVNPHYWEKTAHGLSRRILPGHLQP